MFCSTCNGQAGYEHSIMRGPDEVDRIWIDCIDCNGQSVDPILWAAHHQQCTAARYSAEARADADCSWRHRQAVELQCEAAIQYAEARRLLNLPT